MLRVDRGSWGVLFDEMADVVRLAVELLTEILVRRVVAHPDPALPDAVPQFSPTPHLSCAATSDLSATRRHSPAGIVERLGTQNLVDASDT
jgi:hypothetical protein